MDTSERAVVNRVLRRRRRSVDEKRRIVEKTLQPGASVARVARAHGVNANHVFTWRRQYHRGLLERGTSEGLGLLPVRVMETASETARSRSAPTYRTAPGIIHVELPKGHLRLTGCVEAETLGVGLEKLLARSDWRRGRASGLWRA